MKKLGKIICILLCAVLALSVFGACDPPSEKEGMVKVTFSQNYSGAPEATYAEVEAGSTVEEPEEPSRAEHVFLGWYTDSIGINEFSFDTPVTEDIRLFAKWDLPWPPSYLKRGTALRRRRRA